MMAKSIDKEVMAKKMFEEGDGDDLLIDTERSKSRVTIREEARTSLIQRRSPAQFIPIRSIVKRSVAQVRTSDFDPEKYPEDKCLLESIRSRGVVTPVMVKEYIEDDDDLLADTRYELIYGHRRVSACKVLGFTSVPAFVVEPTVKADEVTMTENIGVRPLNSYERGCEFDRYLSIHDVSIRVFAASNGFTHSYVSQLISAYRSAKTCPEIEMLYRDGILGSRYLPELVKLFENSGEAVRELLIEKLPDLSVMQIKNLLDFCGTGGSPAGYLKSLERPAVIEPGRDQAANCITETPEQNNCRPARESETAAFWNGLASNESFIRKKASVFSCSDEDVKKAVEICGEKEASPEMLRYLLMLRRSGSSLNGEVFESVARIAGDRNTEKVLSLYAASYEKTAERRIACERCIEKLSLSDQADKDILRKILQPESGQNGQ